MSVAIIDDDPNAARVTGMTVEDAGLIPWLIDRQPAWLRLQKDRALKAVADTILGAAEAAVCDHRLRTLGFARFDGAELVATLIGQGLPAVLISQFVDQDYDVSIRHWRALLPSVIPRDDFRPETFAAGLDLCRKEISGELTPQRQRHRVLIRIVDIQREANQRVVDAIIPAWSRQSAVRFPLAIVPTRLQARVKPQGYLIALVNLGANRPEELFFEKFEKPPTPKNALFDHI